MIAQVEARNAGRIIGGILAGLFLVLGIIKCFRIMRRETTSTLCVSALTVALAGWWVASLYGLVNGILQVPPFVAILIAPLVLMFFPVAIVLAIIGLVQYRSRRFDQGRAQAIWAIVIACGMMAAFAAGVAQTIKKNAGTRMAESERQVLEDRNFAITAPEGWRKIDPKALGVADAALGYRHFAPEMYALVFAEQLGDGLAMAQFSELVKENLKLGAEIKEQEEEDVTCNGMTFRRIRSHARMKQLTLDLYYEQWLLSHGGAFWQVVLWGPVREKLAIQEKASAFAERFEVLDRNRRYHAIGTFEDVDLPRYGIKTAIAGKGWNHLASDDTGSALVRTAGERLNEAFLVLPVRTEEELPNLEATVSGLFGLFDFSYPIKGHATERAIDSPIGGEGIEIRTEREGPNGEFEYILRVFRNEKAAFLVAGWASKKGGDLALVKSALDNVSLGESTGPLPELSEREKAALATFYNNAGLHEVRKRNEPVSLNWFKLASELDPTNGQYIANRTYVLAQLGRSDEAFALLDEAYKRFPKSYDLQTQRCMLLVQRGQVEPAYDDFLALIDRGMSEEDKLRVWFLFLQEAGRNDLAEATLEKWNAKQPSEKTQAWQALAMQRAGKLQPAIEYLEGLIKERGSNRWLVTALGELLNEAGEHERAAAAAGKLLESNPQDPDGLQLLGWSQMGRKAYAEAKATFEKAAAAFPDDIEIANAVQRASMALGQGRNSDVKTPIEPVPVPAELAKALENPPLGDLNADDKPLLAISRSTGYRFEKGKPLRTTLRRKFRVLNQAGVSFLSSIDYSFHPSSERIYVNRLKVTDADGKVIAKGTVDDLYVRDAGGEMGTDEKSLLIPVPGVRVGCTIEVEVTKEDRAVTKEFTLVRHRFGHRVPCGIDAVYVTGDVRDLKTSLTLEEQVKTIRKPKLLTWSKSGIQPIVEEPYSPDLTEGVPTLVLASHADSWAALGKRYLADVADRLKPQPEVKELVERICGDLKSTEEKIVALTREVQKSIGYKAIEFGVRARIPNTAADTLRYRYGDCKDQSVLLHQMLSEAGIESHLALVHSAEKVLADLPTLDQFNHMVLHVPALGEGRLLDPTVKYYPVRLPAPGVANSHALILAPSGSRLIASTFEPAPGTGDVNSSRTLKVDGNSWQVTETITFTGYYGAAIRRFYGELTPAEQMQQVQAALAGDGFTEIKEFKIENFDDVEEPVRIKMSYVVREAIKRAGGKATATLPALWERNYIKLDYLAERKTPFEWRNPFRIRSEITLEAPGGKPVRASTQKGTGKGVKWELAQNGSASLTFHFDTEAGRWKPQEYSEIYNQWAAARRALDSPVEWEQF